MLLSFNSLLPINSTLQPKNHHASTSRNGASVASKAFVSRRFETNKNHNLSLSVADSDQVITDSDDQVSAANPPPSDSEEKSRSPIKRSSLTAREKLRAARVLSRYTESKPISKPKLGNNVLDALRESDGGKRRSGLPEAPTNLFDDSKRGMPKSGWTFDFPGGFDLFLIIFSVVFIGTAMFTTAFIVWKLGAIHFNED